MGAEPAAAGSDDADLNLSESRRRRNVNAQEADYFSAPDLPLYNAFSAVLGPSAVYHGTGGLGSGQEQAGWGRGRRLLGLRGFVRDALSLAASPGVDLRVS